MSDLHTRVLMGFDAAFGGAPDGVVRAPGRVNLIGEHTDYNEGFALPAALTVETQIAFRRRDDGKTHVIALDFGGERDAFAPGDGAVGGWRDYVRGAFAMMHATGAPVPPMDLTIAGDIPRGTGLSSSASLEVAVICAVSAAAGQPFQPVAAALLAQKAENDFVGVRCGNLDQLSAAATVEGTALLIDCRSLELRPVPIASDIVIMIVQSGVERGLVDGHYNRRREWCEQAAFAMGVPALRDADLTRLNEARNRMSEEAFRAGRHIITENARTLAAAEALAANDIVTMGRLMVEGHHSMRDDFGLTVEATDRLSALLQEAIGSEGGARQTGGGFGGAVVALMRRDRVDASVAMVRAHYRTPTGAPALIMIEEPRGGASLIG